MNKVLIRQKLVSQPRFADFQIQAKGEKLRKLSVTPLPDNSLLGKFKLNATVLCSRLGRIAARNRLILPEAVGAQPFGRNTKEIHHKIKIKLEVI